MDDQMGASAADGETSGGIPSSIKFVLATILINAIGFGIITPVLPELVMELGHADLSEATAIGGTLSLLYAATQFVCGPLAGNLSDRFGRRPVLLGSLFGFSADFLILAFAPTLTWLYLGRFMSGVFGASNAPAQSAIADAVAPEDRPRMFGLIGAAFGIGFVIGPVIGGVLGEFGHRVPFFAAAALAAANCVYGFLVFPETMARENRRRFQWQRANPVGALLNIRKLPGILPLATVYFLWQVASLIYPMTWNFFAYGRYGWSSAMVGASLSAVGLSMALVQTFLTGRAVQRYGEHKTAQIGIGFGALAMTAYVFIPNGWIAFAAIPLLAMQSLAQPALTAMLSRRATPDTQGEVQGFASSVMSLGAIVAPLLFNPLLAWFTGPSAPFLFWGAAFVVAATFAMTALIVLTTIKTAEQR